MKPDNAVKAFLIIALIINSIIPLSGYVIILSLLFYLIYKGETKNLIFQLSKQKKLLLFIIYIIFCLCRSEYKIYSLIATLILLLVIFIYLTIRTYENLFELSILKYFRITNIIISVLGIIQYYFLQDIYFSSGWIDANIYNINMRAYSTLLNPNVLAGYLVLCICLSILDLEEIKEKKFSILSIILASFCLILTYSRGAWATLYVIILLIFLLRKKIIYILYGIFLCLLMFIINSSSALERININNTIRDHSLFYRLEIYKTMIQIIKDNFIFGTGLNTMRFYINDYSDIIKAPVYHGHNLLLNIVGETGFIGLIFFVIMLITLFKSYIIIAKSDNSTLRKVGFSCFLGLLSIFIHGFIDAVLFAPQFLFYVTFIFSIIFNIQHLLTFSDDCSKGGNDQKRLISGGNFYATGNLRFKKGYYRN